MARYPQEDEQVLPSRFEDMRCEREHPEFTPTVDQAGRLSPEAHPWAKQLVEDIDYLFTFYYEFAVIWNGEVRRLLDPFDELNDMFLNLDSTILKASTFTVCIPPPAAPQEIHWPLANERLNSNGKSNNNNVGNGNVAAPQAEEPDTWICSEVNVAGQVCSCTFPTWKLQAMIAVKAL